MISSAPSSSETLLTMIRVRNFRGFTDLKLDLHPQLTVLVARNGMGKTAVLDACSIALRALAYRLSGRRGAAEIRPGDVRRARTPEGQMVEQLPCSVTTAGMIGGDSATWERRLPARAHGLSPGMPRMNMLAGKLRRALSNYAAGRASRAPNLPVIAHYGTGRLWSEARIGAVRKMDGQALDNPLTAYSDALDRSSSYRSFALWFEAVSYEAQRRGSVPGADGNSLPERYIRAIRSACDHVLAAVGWHTLSWDFLSNSIVARHDEAGELPIEMLSDGVRNAVALVADLAHRCARLNPHLGADAPRLSPGIVLIDEVDLHLHPGWQQQIVPALRKAFPCVQFIVTTHSPQVLSSVPNECIRVIEQGPDGATCRTPALQTEGVPSPEVMASVMGVDPAPDLAIRRDLDRYRALIQDGTYLEAEGAELRGRLLAHFGEDHPLIRDVERLVRFRRAVLARRDNAEG